MKDYFGIEAKVGDEIVHVSSRSSSISMKLGVVVEVDKYWLKWEHDGEDFKKIDGKYTWVKRKKITKLTAANFMVLSRYDLTA